MHICEVFHSVCVDVDFLLHIIGFRDIDNIIKNLQENVSRNEIDFKWSFTNTFQVLLITFRLIKWKQEDQNDSKLKSLIKNEFKILVFKSTDIGHHVLPLNGNHSQKVWQTDRQSINYHYCIIKLLTHFQFLFSSI